MSTRRNILSCYIVWFFLAAAESAQAGSVLSFPELLEKLLQNNWQVKLQSFEIALADNKIEQAEAAGSAQGQMQWFLAPVDKPSWDEKKGFNAWRPQNEQGQYIQPWQNGGTGLTLTQMGRLQFFYPIYSFGALQNLKKAAEKNKDLTLLQSEQLENQVVLQLAQVYYGLALSWEVQKFLDEIESYLKKALSPEKKTKLAKSDLFPLEFAQLTLEKEKTSLKAQIYQGLQLIKLLSALPVEEEMEIADKGLAYPQYTLPKKEDLWLEASTKRLEKKQLTAGSAALKNLAEAERNSRWPVFVAGTQVNFAWSPGRYHPQNPFIADPFNQVQAGLGLGFIWNLNFAAKAAAATAYDLQASKLNLAEKLLDDGIKLELNIKLREFEEAIERLKILDEQKKTTRAWIQYTLQSSDLGFLDAKKLVDSMLAFVDTQKNFFSVKLLVHQKYWELKIASGTRLSDLLKHSH